MWFKVKKTHNFPNPACWGSANCHEKAVICLLVSLNISHLVFSHMEQHKEGIKEDSNCCSVFFFAWGLFLGLSLSLSLYQFNINIKVLPIAIKYSHSIAMLSHHLLSFDSVYISNILVPRVTTLTPHLVNVKHWHQLTHKLNYMCLCI